jgi:hypothetical protein
MTNVAGSADITGIKDEAIHVTSREGSKACETSRIPHFLDNWLIDGGRPPFTPRKSPGTHLCSRPSRPQGHSAAGRIRSVEKSNDLIGARTRDLPACSVVPPLTT